MAKKRTEAIIEEAFEPSNDDGMDEISEAVAVVNNQKIKEAFMALPNGEKYYLAFRKTMKDEITRLITGPQDEVVGALEDRLEAVIADIEQAGAYVRSLTNERVFSVLDVVSRNFGGRPLPKPAASNSAVVEETKQEESAQGKGYEISGQHSASETPQDSNHQRSSVSAPSFPPRGGRLPGFY
jgi:hypothetical protein